MDTTLNLAYAGGLIVGLILAAVILTVMSKTRNKAGKLRMEFDERQKADRNASFATGFFLLVVLELVMAVLRQNGIRLPMDYVTETVICCLAAAAGRDNGRSDRAGVKKIGRIQRRDTCKTRFM